MKGKDNRPPNSPQVNLVSSPVCSGVQSIAERIRDRENAKRTDHRNALTTLTSARIGVDRVGTRPLTQTWLNFRADHALARDAVWSELSQEFVDKLGYLFIQTTAENKEEFLLNPDSGRRISEETKQKIKESFCSQLSSQSCPNLQIVICDGLSAKAIEANVPDLLPLLLDGLEQRNITCNQPIVVRYGRVAVGDIIAETIGAKIIVNLIGERPGLRTPESMSAYLTYNPSSRSLDSERTVLSNIHSEGTPAVEAGAYLAELVEKILREKASGVNLKL